ncbi:hypothetical protein TUM4636_27650 [Shewanella glacialipiscicola]|uniref:Uncharacterized protein n=1 Tax=Shewanella glacialipiscicola TaxID=614069 RepID=A0ABQ6J7Q8_9GAMM|nr:hypothetical protein TUM4636_27650 [Shewanella glacialipiscicola]GMA84173.1 hypothetical protein GCM10025855_37060 [Shewanella glacialipiscicola]
MLSAVSVDAHYREIEKVRKGFLMKKDRMAIFYTAVFILRAKWRLIRLFSAFINKTLD